MTINEWDDAAEMPAPCQPIGCDNGYHLPDCYYAAADADDDTPGTDDTAGKAPAADA